MLSAAATCLGVGLVVGLILGPTATAVAPPDPATAVRFSLPGLVAGAGDPVLSGFTETAPARGRLAQVSGPFDDRFTLSETTLTNGTARGVVTVTSDVSEVIDLQVQVGFYDADGSLLGTGIWEKHGEGSHPDEVARFTVTAPPTYRDRVAAAAVGVPVLVNE